MDAISIKPETNHYWNLLKGLNKETKLELISCLSCSLLPGEKEAKVSASSFYGVWKDDDSTSADEMIKEIKDSRSFKDDVLAF